MNDPDNVIDIDELREMKKYEKSLRAYVDKNGISPALNKLMEDSLIDSAVGVAATISLELIADGMAEPYFGQNGELKLKSLIYKG